MPMDFINQNVLLIGLVVVSGLSLLWPMLAGQSGSSVNPAEATLLINREDAQILDVREADEFAAGHLSEAKNIPASKLAERIGELEKFKDKPVILSCQSGGRSSSACEVLRKAGFTNVHNLEGGVAAWEQAGMPISRKKK